MFGTHPINPMTSRNVRNMFQAQNSPQKTASPPPNPSAPDLVNPFTAGKPPKSPSTDAETETGTDESQFEPT